MTEVHHTTTAQPSAHGELPAILDSIPTEGILCRLAEERTRGPVGYPKLPLLRAHIWGFLNNVKSTNDVIRSLRADSGLQAICGFEDDLPTRRTFNRFNARLARVGLSVVESEILSLTHGIAESGAVPGFGEKIAIDSTNVPTHSSPRRPVGTDVDGKKVYSDPDAGWTAKSVPNPRPGSDKKKKKKSKDWFFGYKFHAAVDAASGIPMAGFTTPANVSDSPTLPTLLKEIVKEFGAPKAVMADKGYDSQPNHDAIRKTGAEPIIDIRKDRSPETEASDLHTTDGILKCIGGEPMERLMHDPEKGRLYRCNTEGCHLKTRKGVRYCDTVVWNKLEASRRYPLLPRSSPEWKRLYRMRQSVERLFKSLKQSRRLASHCSRGRVKIALHAAMSVLAFQATALHWIRTGRIALLRWMVDPVR